MAGGGEGLQRERSAVEGESGAEMPFKLGARMSRDFDGGELPHAGEENVIMSAGIADEEGTSARIAEDGGGDADLDGFWFAARRGNGAGEIASAGEAVLGDGACGAARILRRADGFAEFHEGLVPVAGRGMREKLIGCAPELAPAARGAQVAANGVEPREDAGDVPVEHGERNVVGDA